MHLADRKLPPPRPPGVVQSKRGTGKAGGSERKNKEAVQRLIADGCVEDSGSGGTKTIIKSWFGSWGLSLSDSILDPLSFFNRREVTLWMSLEASDPPLISLHEATCVTEVSAVLR